MMQVPVWPGSLAALWHVWERYWAQQQDRRSRCRTASTDKVKWMLIRHRVGKKKKIWAPPVFIPLPQWTIGRRRRMPPLVLMKRDWLRSLFSRFAVETVHNCDCFSEVWSEFHRWISAWFVQWEKTVVLESLVLLKGWAIGLFTHLEALLLGPANLELRITKNWISLVAIVNSIKILFVTSPSRMVDQEMLFLCLSFAVPSTTRSSLSDDVVRDWESIPVVIGEKCGWIRFHVGDVHKCNRLFLESNTEGILSIALLELFRTTRTTLHCPFHESSLSIRHWML